MISCARAAGFRETLNILTQMWNGAWFFPLKRIDIEFDSELFTHYSVYNCVNQYTSSAFLFSLVNKPGWGPVKLTKEGYRYLWSYSTYSCSSYGPTFGGGHDIFIASYASSNTNSYSNLGHTYSPPSGHSYSSSFTRSFLAGSYTFQPDEVEVFYETI